MYSKSSFHGDIFEIPDICVDNFTKKGRRAYFLSHCHTDHTEGLYSKHFLQNLIDTKACIYMSEASAAIVKFEDDRLESFIRPLKLGSITITIPGDEKYNKEDTHLNVKLIPAGHCLGSVMFLFETSNKTLLYTGDFRISQNSVAKYGQLHVNGEPINIDTMYVDTTFQNAKYDNFPKRSESIKYLIDEIRQWLKKDNNKVALHTSAKYGYEFVFNEIYKELHEKVYVKNQQLYRLYSQFPEKISGVTNDSQNTKIHLCYNRNHNKLHDGCIHEFSNCDFLYIHLSAFKWEDYDIELPGIRKEDNRIDVCFATHCSRNELIYFVNYFSPKYIVGFKDPYNPKNCEKTFEDEYVQSPKKKNIVTNEAEKVKVLKKVDRNVLKEIFG